MMTTNNLPDVLAPRRAGAARSLLLRSGALGSTAKPRGLEDGAATQAVGNCSFGSSASSSVPISGSEPPCRQTGGRRQGSTGFCTFGFDKAGILQLKTQTQPLARAFCVHFSPATCRSGAVSPHTKDSNHPWSPILLISQARRVTCTFARRFCCSCGRWWLLGMKTRVQYCSKFRL